MILLVAACALAPRFFLGAYVIAVAGWLLVRRAKLPIAAVLGIGLLLRAILAFPQPALSGDVYRYLWDGLMSRQGMNPYAYAPAEAPIPRPPWHARINHPEIASIYPPHAQLLFAAAPSLTSWRVLIALFDVLLILALRRSGLALAYATFPLLLFEGAWSGHVDAIAGAFVALSMLHDSGIALGFASGLKVIPIAAAPAMIRSRRFAIGVLLTLVLPALPFLGKPFMPGFREYATRWIFNSPLYGLIFAVVSRIPTKEIWTHHPLRFQMISDVVYRHVHPDFVTRAVLLVLACGGIAIASLPRRWSAPEPADSRKRQRGSVSGAIGALLICSPAIHPWYWLVLAAAAMIEGSAWIWVALSAPFSYLLYDGAPGSLVYALCYGVPVAVMLLRPSARASSGAGSRFAALRFRRARDTSRS